MVHGILINVSLRSPHNNDKSLSRQRLASTALPEPHHTSGSLCCLTVTYGEWYDFHDVALPRRQDITDVTYVCLSCLVYIIPNITCQLVACHQCDAYQNNLGDTHQCTCQIK